MNDRYYMYTCTLYTDKKRADSGWGYPQFLAHDKLQYNAERQTQYLKDNTLQIRVMKVTLLLYLCLYSLYFTNDTTCAQLKT